MAFTGLEGNFLLVHGLRVEQREGIRRAAERGIHRSIHLIQPRRHGLLSLRHVDKIPEPLQQFLGHERTLTPAKRGGMKGGLKHLNLPSKEGSKGRGRQAGGGSAPDPPKSAGTSNLEF